MELLKGIAVTETRHVNLFALRLDDLRGKGYFEVENKAFSEKLQALLRRLGVATASSQTGHDLVATVIEQCVRLSDGSRPAPQETRRALEEHVVYHGKILERYSRTPLSQVGGGVVFYDPSRTTVAAVELSLSELVQHCSSILEQIAPLPNVSGEIDSGVGSEKGSFADYLPAAIRDLKTEANMRLIEPWFFQSLDTPGDICEFGCFRGTMSVKLATTLQALKIADKMVYAFDTFEGFQIADPGGGALGIGAYSDAPETFGELTLWSKIIPITPVRGDATETWRTLKRPLSFVWLDLDMEVLLAPVLDGIWPLLSTDTIIGIDDIGRPETPTVLPWVERLVANGRLIPLEIFLGTDHVGLYRAALQATN